ncbi:ATP binding protein family member protein [Theileria equi strain WA]|uniref:GPN-loop GTPase 3 n=1 Tax=Theileria equi strain WA TaxID=1537102 RepID=L1LCT8_THEEQ|nr:ATP binding protein family member protein [Theileria equi strain WA]EKX72983.1 ATP binding protein family member protein [Theileria equi strain WA]|eukprot:XP_004832435.1 ATP binding protein family member protein [Theileria equi strain WA]
MRYAQIVLGPAGSGKTTYCKMFQEYLSACKRVCHIINLDPATEEGIVFDHEKKSKKPGQKKEEINPFDTDIRDFVDIGAVVEEEELGPNGALVRSAELLGENIEWLAEQIEETYGDEAYLLFDTPGQIELFIHIPYVKRITQLLQRLGINALAVFLLDVSFMTDPSKLISGSLAGLAAMVNLEMPHINILSKCDLLYDADTTGNINLKPFADVTSSTFGLSKHHLNFQKSIMSGEDCEDMNYGTLCTSINKSADDLVEALDAHLPPTYRRLNTAFASLLEDFDLVGFLPLNINDELSLEQILVATDVALQYGEEAEPSAKFDLSDTI